MPGQPKIRWTKAQIKELYRDVRAYNTARTRALKGDSGLVNFLPEKLDVKELRSRIETRSQLKTLTSMVNRELKYKFEVEQVPEGYVLKSRADNLMALVEKSNRLKKTIAKERGIKVSPEGTIGTMKEAELKPFRTDILNIPYRDWEKFERVVAQKSTRDYYSWEAELYQQNYIEALWRVIGATEETLEIVEMVQSLKPEIFYRATLNNPDLKIDFIYDHKEKEIAILIERLREGWSNVR